MTKPLLKFKVWCRLKHGPKTPFFWCSVWRTLPQMRQHLLDINSGLAYGTSKFKTNRAMAAYGACYSWKAESADVFAERVRGPQKGKMRLVQKGSLQPEMGVIVLAMAYTGAATVSHECAHAAHRFAERMLVSRRKRTEHYCEELFCSVVGEMSRQIVKRLLAWDRLQARRKG